jgi:ABC-type Fe3+ transport system permease subunit
MILIPSLPSSEPRWGEEELDRLARHLLYYCNFTVAMCVAVGLILIYAVVHLAWQRNRNILGPVAFILHAVSALYIGVSSVAALTFAKNPPNAQAFDPNEWRLIGTYVFSTGLFYGLYELTRVFVRGFHRSTTVPRPES